MTSGVAVSVHPEVMSASFVTDFKEKNVISQDYRLNPKNLVLPTKHHPWTGNATRFASSQLRK